MIRSKARPVLLRQSDTSRGSVICGHRVIMAMFHVPCSPRFLNIETVDVCDPPGRWNFLTLALAHPISPVLTTALEEVACATPWESLCGSFQRSWFMHTQHRALPSLAHIFLSAKRQSYFFSH